MTKACLLVALLTAVLGTGCASHQVQRDIDHAAQVSAYRASLAGAGDFSIKSCVAPPAQKTWATVEFSEASSRYALPNGVKALAYCVELPTGARVLELHSASRGGISFYQLMLAHPSVLFLDSQGRVLEDLAEPRLSPGEDFFAGFKLSGNVVISDARTDAKWVVVYIHPAVLDDAVTVHTGYQTIPVPFSPFGTVKLRFQ